MAQAARVLTCGVCDMTSRLSDRFRQGLSVGFPAGRQRNFVDFLKMVGDHVVGKVFLQVLLQGLDIQTRRANDVGQ